MVKIQEYRVRKNGNRGVVLTIPKVFVDDNHLAPGDLVEIFRESTGPDRLVIQKKVVSQKKEE